MSDWNGDLLMEKGNWKIRKGEPGMARLWHMHYRGASECSTEMVGTMRCHECNAKPPAALRGLVMITNWSR